MSSTAVACVRHLIDEYRRFLRSSYRLADPKLRAQFEEHISQADVLVKGPYITLARDFAQKREWGQTDFEVDRTRRRVIGVSNAFKEFLHKRLTAEGGWEEDRPRGGRLQSVPTSSVAQSDGQQQVSPKELSVPGLQLFTTRVWPRGPRHVQFHSVISAPQGALPRLSGRLPTLASTLAPTLALTLALTLASPLAL